MQLELASFISQAQVAKNLDELCQLFEKTLSKFGFERWAYQVLSAAHDKDKTPVILANYPTEWVTHYIEQQYNTLDPVIKDGPKEVLPFSWSGLCKKINLTKKQKTFFAEAADFGLPDGMGIPMHGGNGAYAMVSIANTMQSSEDMLKMLAEHEKDIHLISLVFHTIAKDLIALNRLVGNKIELSKREQDCLTWCAKGKTTWEISNFLYISEPTVKFHIANARAKIGVFSTREAIVKAFLLGLIKP